MRPPWRVLRENETVMTLGIPERYQAIRAELDRVCLACGRNPEDVRLVAVSKLNPPEAVGQALVGGAADFGENRPDELLEKAPLYPAATWHFIGNIQSRRIRDIVPHAALIHSLFQMDHAEKISRAAGELGKVQDVLVEVNVSGEASKSGLTPGEAVPFAQEISQLPNIRLRGLMTMAPAGDREAAEAAFQGLASLRETIRAALPEDQRCDFNELSMGMSDDWPIAVACGATIVRVGRAIFSDAFHAAN